MARLNVWGWAVVEVAKMRRLVFSEVPSLMVGEQLPPKQQGSRSQKGWKCHFVGAQFRPRPDLQVAQYYTHLCPNTGNQCTLRPALSEERVRLVTYN